MQLPFFRKKKESSSTSTPRPSSACVPRSSFLKKRRGADNSDAQPQHKLPVISASGKYLDEDPSWKIDSTPSPDDWWQKEEEEETNHGKEGKFTKEEMDLASTEEESDQEPKTHFRNIGLENWERSRKQWRKRTVTGKIERPPNIRYDQVVRGLSQVQRTYELPGRMTLPDIINVFIDIWHSY